MLLLFGGLFQALIVQGVGGIDLLLHRLHLFLCLLRLFGLQLGGGRRFAEPTGAEQGRAGNEGQAFEEGHAVLRIGRPGPMAAL